jgi:hypothetical protein
MNRYMMEEFRMYCFNSTDNKLINIALDKMQLAEYDEDKEFHAGCAGIAIEELERRGLDVECLQNADADFDIDQVA